MLSYPFKIELTVATEINFLSIFNYLPQSCLVFAFVAPDSLPCLGSTDFAFHGTSV